VRRRGLVRLGSARKALQPLLLAMLTARVISPASKLAPLRLLHDETASSSLGRVLGVGQCSADELYRALDWLHEAQPGIERRLACQHLVGSTPVLYDLTSTWLTGRCCELAARGHSRDGKRDDPQIVFGGAHRAGAQAAGHGLGEQLAQHPGDATGERARAVPAFAVR